MHTANVTKNAGVGDIDILIIVNQRYHDCHDYCLNYVYLH